MEAQDLSHFVRHPADGVAAMDLVVNGVYCGACIVAIEKGLGRQAGVRRRPRQSRQQARDRRMERRRDRAAGDPRAARGAGLPGLSLHGGARRQRRAPGGEAPAALPRRRRVRRDERHAALGLAVGRGRKRPECRDPRPVPLALRAGRAAVRGLCRHALLRERRALDPGRRAQHGRADLDRRHPRSGDVRSFRPSRISASPISRARSCC